VYYTIGERKQDPKSKTLLKQEAQKADFFNALKLK